jgi:dienelactone hydrolase
MNLSLALLLALAPAQARSSEPPIVVREALTLTGVTRGGRVAFHIDPVQRQIVEGKWAPPQEGDEIASPDNKPQTWQKATVGEDGWFSGARFQGGYAYCSVRSDRERIVILEAAGHASVYVNGELRTGDPYGYGYLKTPIKLRQGRNDFLFSTSRGRLRVQLSEPPSRVYLHPEDMTLPDVTRADAVPWNPAQNVRGRQVLHAGAVIVNATEAPARVNIAAQTEGGTQLTTRTLVIPPLATYKAPFTFDAARMPEGETLPLSLSLQGVPQGPPLQVTLRVRRPEQTRKETFLSDIDGSVQYYAVVPPPNPGPRQGLVLSLHGASVEATSQADAYSPKPGMWIVCPTNRRPFGFDWEDWGRMDALETLRIAQARFTTDPARTYLTGHSMGGHGTWNLSANFPQHFAAIAPSAGWRSFFTYGGKPRPQNPNPVQAIIERTTNPSDTEALARNFMLHGVYILHGDQDDNVPITEAQAMRDLLQGLKHPDLGYHEEPGAGHWWDGDRAAGADCVDWPPIFEMFRRRTIRTDFVGEFLTFNPGLNPGPNRIKVLGQQTPLALSRIALDSFGGDLTISTENVTAFQLDLGRRLPPSIIVNGNEVKSQGAGPTIFALQSDGQWEQARSAPDRIPLFKEVFQNRAILVYSTGGTPEENAWSYRKARYDAENFYYRGNGAFRVMADEEVMRMARVERGNLILYGNADTNKMWAQTLASAPITVRRGHISVNGKRLDGEHLAGLFVHRPAGFSYVAAVSGTGLIGMRLTDRLPYFVSGTGYPHWTVFDTAVLVQGVPAAIGAGFYGPEGKVDGGDYAWSR